ncbi:MAG: protein kinase [Bryobacteraceae bacterium]
MSSQLLPGQRLGHYTVVSFLAAGGMGEVYRARDTRLGRDVALKILSSEVAADAGRRERFEQEARTVASLNHPNIATVFDIGSEDGRFYMVSELVEGEPLRGVPLSVKKVMEVGAQIAEGLAAAHAVRVTHRDVKPDNVMLTGDGRVKILDFGLAKTQRVAVSPQDETVTAGETVPGVVMGTIQYMSPEQVRGKDVDGRSDIFSLGLVLYELLAGRRAFERESAVETMNAILKEDAADLPESVPPGLRRVVARCMEKEPGSRFQSAKDLAFALRDQTGGSPSSSTVVAAIPAVRGGRRWMVAAAALGGILAGGAFTLWMAGGEDVDPVVISTFVADPAGEQNPEFSPDGRSVAYRRGKAGKTELVVRSLSSETDAVVASLNSVGSHRWTPDGKRLCFADLRHISCVGASGGNPQPLLDIQSFTVFQFTPDGKSLLVPRAENGKKQLYASTPPGNPPTVVAGFPLGEGWSPGPMSPDGKRIVLQNFNRPLRIVSYPSGAVQGEYPDIYLVGGWFRDSRHIVATTRNPYGVVLLDTKSHARRLLLRQDAAVISSALSPDNKRILYSSGKVDWSIHEYSMEGKRLPAAASPGAGTGPVWSADGQRYAFNANTGTSREGVWMARADGSQARQIVSRRNYAPVSFSPDGQRLAVMVEKELRTVSLTNGVEVTVQTVSPNAYVCWSAGGDWLWFSEQGEVKKIPSLGGEPAVVTKGSLTKCDPRGKWFAVFRDKRMYLLSTDGKTERAVAGDHDVFSFSGFSADGNLYFTSTIDNRLNVEEPATGKIVRSVVFEMDPADRVWDLDVHPDGNRVLVSLGGLRYDIFSIEGFAQPAAWWKRWFRHWDPPAK